MAVEFKCDLCNLTFKRKYNSLIHTTSLHHKMKEESQKKLIEEPKKAETVVETIKPNHEIIEDKYTLDEIRHILKTVLLPEILHSEFNN